MRGPAGVLVKVDDIPEDYRRNTTENYVYGTAGFRRRALDLGFVVYRVGMLGGLRSRKVGGVVGIMITASHNPKEDNGVKLVEPHGEMLVQDWEKYATKIVNVPDAELDKTIKEIAEAEGISLEATAGGHVFSGYDTRDSSPSLEKAAKAGAEALGVKVTSFGLLTTPQLHFIVRSENTGGVYGEASEAGYYKKYSEAFKLLNMEVEAKNYNHNVFVDAANGVGAPKLKIMAEQIVTELLNITIKNAGEGDLNHKCGADFVKLHQAPPSMEGAEVKTGQRWASLDGDADRVVYYYTDPEGGFHLLDGDKIAVLIAAHIGGLLEKTGLKEEVKMGLVQTAYANGNSTRYIQDDMNIPVFCVPTGVKNLHKQAEELDVGVYFEANGHGTVLFSQTLKDKLNGLKENGRGDSPTAQAAEKLSNFINLVNETVGDALADMLVVETILRERDWGEKEWDGMYTDLPSRQLKVPVPDRSVIKTTDAERKVSSPALLQDNIDELLKGYGDGARTFVRPSGTEDIVRVYAEADTQENADKLAKEVEKLVIAACDQEMEKLVSAACNA